MKVIGRYHKKEFIRKEFVRKEGVRKEGVRKEFVRKEGVRKEGVRKDRETCVETAKKLKRDAQEELYEKKEGEKSFSLSFLFFSFFALLFNHLSGRFV